MSDTVRIPRVSIIVPCRDEERYIEPCLASIVRTEYPMGRLEALVVDGRSTDRTRSIVARYAQDHPWLRLLDNPAQAVPAALNLGIRHATGDVIVRMDAHVRYPPDYVSRLVAALEETGADNVGGRIVTLPADGSAFARAIAIALSHRFGVGNSYFRIGAPTRRWVDTVPFGCFRRDVFRRVGLFDEELVRNQDDEFNFRLTRQGGRVLLAPDVVAYYYARATLRQLSRMYYQYGFFKPLVARKVGRIMTVRQLVPAAFLLAVVLASLAALVWPAAAVMAGALIGTYAAAVVGCALPVARRHGPRCALALLATFPTLHGSYGCGFLRGVWHVAFGRRRGRVAVTTMPLSR